MDQIAKQQLIQLQNGIRILDDSAITTVRTAQRAVDALLADAFRAQRSVEIYTLKDVSGLVYYDSGFIHPDIEADFASELLDRPSLIQAYQASWANLLQPISLQNAYVGYFSGDPNYDFAPDLLTLEFTAPDLLSRFRTSRTLQFAIETLDLPSDVYEAKVERVEVALVGVLAPNDRVRCIVRHGDRYSQRQRDGQESTMLLEPRATLAIAPTVPLSTIGLVPTSGIATLSAPKFLSFWGRGVGGVWEVKIAADTPGDTPPDLSNLTEIQVWIALQVFISNA
ncbi:MAG: hypothetical protein SFV81_20025 [Pirellulaceae bacterium]|nr:hypothetical protein [Pirellulaceae bacterium]